MWRPFASDFVAHTYEDFRKKFDKVWTAKPIQSKPLGEKFDPKCLFPYRLGKEELERRENEFVLLQLKVNKQRKEIKQRDETFRNNLKLRSITQKEELKSQKKNIKKTMLRIRSMASNKIHRYASSEIPEYYSNNNTFALTSPGKPPVISKNVSIDSKIYSYPYIEKP